MAKKAVEDPATRGATSVTYLAAVGCAVALAMSHEFVDVVPGQRLVMRTQQGPFVRSTAESRCRPWRLSSIAAQETNRPSMVGCNRVCARSAMYRDSSLVIEHRFNVIAEVQRYGPSQPAGDDDVASLDEQTLQCQLANQPDNTQSGMT